MTQILVSLASRLGRSAEERGAVGALVIGIILGALLVVFGIIKFLIPGE